MWIWANHNFSWWPYVALRLKALASRCHLPEGLRRKAKKQIIHILQQSRTSREPYIIQISLQDFWEIRRTLSKIPGYYCPAELFLFFFSQVKAKSYCLASSSRILKNVLHKSIAVKNLLLMGMNICKVWELETTTECQGITMLFIVSRSGKYLLLACRFLHR